MTQKRRTKQGHRGQIPLAEGGQGGEGSGSPASNPVGELIRARRRACRMTLQQLADAAGCAKSYLWLIERGRGAKEGRPVSVAPGEGLLGRLEDVLGFAKGELVEAARWQAIPASVRLEMSAMAGRARAAERLAALLRGGREGEAGGRASLDEAYRSGELRRLVDQIAPPPPAPGRPSGTTASPAGARGWGEGGGSGPDRLVAPDRSLLARPLLPLEVPLINKVAAGYPRSFTDLGYPARVADEYVRCPDLSDPDAFAARVVGDSMAPTYLEGDIVVFSPARAVKSGMDCFARIEPDHESTFKRVYFETGPGGEALIRLQPLNAAHPPRVLARDHVAGLYAAVSVTRGVA